MTNKEAELLFIRLQEVTRDFCFKQLNCRECPFVKGDECARYDALQSFRLYLFNDAE